MADLLIFPRAVVTASVVEKRISGYQFNPRNREHGFTGAVRGGVYVIIQEVTAKQRVNLGLYGNESKKDRYMEGPLL